MSHIQWGVTLRKALAGVDRCGVCRLDQVASQQTGRWREEIDGPMTGGTCTPGKVWPADRCNRNKAGQVTVGAGTVKRWRGYWHAASPGGGWAGQSGAGEEDSIEIKRGSEGRVGRPGLSKG